MPREEQNRRNSGRKEKLQAKTTRIILMREMTSLKDSIDQ